MNEINTSKPMFILNGKAIEIDSIEPTESLLRWLNRRGHSGTKEGCGDGDCGACTVAMMARDVNGQACLQSVNACLLPMGGMIGREVITVEALAVDDRLHPAQQAMVNCAGSQCGYCTPGFVMSLMVGLHNDELGDHAIEGNLCRCTGYQSIREAASRLHSEFGESKPFCDQFTKRLRENTDALPASSIPTFYSPTSIADALDWKKANPEAMWIAGATDLGVLLSRRQVLAKSYIALDRIEALQEISQDGAHLRLGAGVSMSRIEKELRGRVPMLDQMLPWFAARQVKNRATVGGNVGSASPIGDLLPILLALDAAVELIGVNGSRCIPIHKYFLDYRKTAKHADEIIAAVAFEIPDATSARQAFYKVAKRQTDDISIVAAAFVLRLDAHGVVQTARLAYGGVAAIPKRATEAEAHLCNQKITPELTETVAAQLQSSFSPLSDQRASAEYRSALCANLWRRFALEQLS